MDHATESERASIRAIGAADSDPDTAYVAGLEADVQKLGRRCLARERAIESLSAAVIALRRANHALSDELSLLRLEIERCRALQSTETANAPQAA